MQQPNITRQNKNKRDLYFTDDHEWIDFQGSVAYTGICTFKLKGIKSIERIDFAEAGGLYGANEIIGCLYYAEYKIDIHMPVAGRILSFNDSLLAGHKELLLEQPENAGWFALIVPALPYDRQGLVISEKYQMKTRSPWQKD
jgi:glycine cleavage system H protein